MPAVRHLQGCSGDVCHVKAEDKIIPVERPNVSYLVPYAVESCCVVQPRLVHDNSEDGDPCDTSSLTCSRVFMRYPRVFGLIVYT